MLAGFGELEQVAHILSLVETRITKAQAAIAANQAKHQERQAEIYRLTEAYNASHEVTRQSETSYELSKGTPQEQVSLLAFNEAQKESMRLYDTMIARTKLLTDYQRRDNRKMEEVKSALTEDERERKELLQEQTRLLQARQEAHQNHGEALFSHFDLALRGNRDRMEALHCSEIDCSDARDDILAHARHGACQLS